MKKVYTLFYLMFMLCCMTSMADSGTWTFKWDTAKASGGEGFYHMTDNEDTIQTTTLNKIEWKYASNCSVTIYTAASGQVFGSAKSPVIHSTLSTEGIKGQISSISVEAKTKDAAQVVTVSAKVNGKSYKDAEGKISSTLSNEQKSYTFKPANDAEEGKIEILIDQTSETKGMIYFLSMSITYEDGVTEELNADFTADGQKQAYYKMGWDSLDEANTWSYYYTNSDYTWTITDVTSFTGTKPFSVFEGDSKNSLAIFYDEENAQRERAVSPEIKVKENSEVEFYACFSAVWLFSADWSLVVNDVTAGTSDVLVSGLNWSNDNEFTGPSWVKFNYDLTKYAGHTCTFEFKYEGMGGDDLYIDGFKINQATKDANAKINAIVGKEVQFKDTSAGKPDSWEWSFPGADVTTSKEQNPIVTYSTPGEYDVKLTIKKGEEESYITKKGIVIVKEENPIACIGNVEGGYLSPWALAFVPTNVPVKFTEVSTGKPTEYKWTFTGTSKETYTDKNPIVTYTKEGLYNVTLEVSNTTGSSTDIVKSAIKADGALDIWNITPEESSELQGVSLSYFGNYAGTNWLGMRTFAEHFDKPLAPATIDMATVYFDTIDADDKNGVITVAICPADANGNPGEAIASKSLKISELQCDEYEIVGTDFEFGKEVTVNSEFFVTITGFPNEDENDNVAVLCVLRDEDGKCTAYHEIEDEDENNQGLGTYQWFKNVGSPLSIAMTAHLKYDNSNATAIVAPTAVNNGATATYSVDGKKLDSIKKAGLYIQRTGKDARKIMVK